MRLADISLFSFSHSHVQVIDGWMDGGWLGLLGWYFDMT